MKWNYSRASPRERCFDDGRQDSYVQRSILVVNMSKIMKRKSVEVETHGDARAC